MRRPLPTSPALVIKALTATFHQLHTCAHPSPFSHLLHHIQLSIDRGSLSLAHQTLALVFSLGLHHHHPILSSKLISAYSFLGFPSLSRLVFDATPGKNNVLLWNSLLAAYSRNNHFQATLSIFKHMVLHALPDNYTLAILSKAAGELRDLNLGMAIHSLTTRLGFCWDSVLMNSLMVIYFNCENPSDGRKLFDEMPVRSVSSWNALISEHTSSGDGLRGEVWGLVLQMQSEGVKPDAFTISTILPLVAVDSGGRLLNGRELHCFVVRNMILDSDSDFHVGSCLIDMYSKGKKVVLGRQVFDQMIWRNVVTWTAMITGYVWNGEFEEALLLFRKMQFRDGIVPNRVTLLSIILAVGSLAGLMEGKQIHGFAMRKKLNSEASLNNALMDMYVKSGSLGCARRIFDDNSWQKDVISWRSMVSGYGLHGRGNEAIALYHQMCGVGTKLDHITCVAVLSACGRSGLVTEGFTIYTSLLKEHQIHPTIEICSCMVDMLCRAGQLNQALDFINSMPLDPSASVWGPLFVSSMTCGNLEMQDLARKFLLQLEPKNPSNYVSLSNLHASSGRWDIVADVRTRMKESGLSKLPGCSWIVVNN